MEKNAARPLHYAPLSFLKYQKQLDFGSDNTEEKAGLSRATLEISTAFSSNFPLELRIKIHTAVAEIFHF